MPLGESLKIIPPKLQRAWWCLMPYIKYQAEHANDMAVRWNCKAGKCGSCSAEINGVPKLMCMTRLSDLSLDKPVLIQPMKAFPLIKDLVQMFHGISG